MLRESSNPQRLGSEPTAAACVIEAARLGVDMAEVGGIFS